MYIYVCNVYIDQHTLIHALTCRHPHPLQYVLNLRESCPTCTNESCPTWERVMSHMEMSL